MYLKKTLEMIGLSIFICFSFMFTDKVTDIMKENDEIMTSVKENKSFSEINSVNAKINNDEIIPGLNGKVVDVEKSYQIMKKIGYYNDSLYVYKEEEPEISVKDNYDKYIVSGNKTQKNITIIFKINDNKNIDDIFNLLKNNKMSSNFFISYEWATNNLEKIKYESLNGHNFGSLSYENNLLTVNSLIKINSDQKNYYCYTEKKDITLLNDCSKNKYYTIIPSIIIDSNLLSNVMKSISPGSIITININRSTISELSNTLDYISSKGYKVVNLDTILQE